MSDITLVQIDGATVDLSAVEYQVNVTHGRNDVSSQPEASSCQVIIRGAVGVATEIAATLIVEAYGVRRFTGQVTDVDITHLPSPAGQPVAITTVTGMGNLSKLGQITVGAAGYPEQNERERAQAILDDIGLPSLNNTTAGITLLAQPVTDFLQDAYTALTQLAQTVGATFSDLPNGFLSFETYSQRGIVYQEGSWASQLFPWNDYDPALEWGDVDTGPAVTQAGVPLPSPGVRFTPEWSNRLTQVLNTVTVSYGSNDPQDTFTATSAASITKYGKREFILETQLKNLADATDRAGSIITAQGEPLYGVRQLSILMHALSSGELAVMLGLVEGRRVIVSDLPAPGPYTQFQGIIEGWSETYTPGEHFLTLSISDPRYSRQTVTWGDVDAALEWGDVNPLIEWYNVVTSDDLAA